MIEAFLFATPSHFDRETMYKMERIDIGGELEREKERERKEEKTKE